MLSQFGAETHNTLRKLAEQKGLLSERPKTAARTDDHVTWSPSPPVNAPVRIRGKNDAVTLPVHRQVCRTAVAASHSRTVLDCEDCGARVLRRLGGLWCRWVGE